MNLDYAALRARRLDAADRAASEGDVATARMIYDAVAYGRYAGLPHVVVPQLARTLFGSADALTGEEL